MINKTATIDISVITVTWNAQDTITDQLRSVISACKDISFEQIVVDNASTDETVNRVKAVSAHIELIVQTHNLGFAAANNQGARDARGRYLLFLNPDMKINKGALDDLVAWMDQHSQVGIVGCKLTRPDGTYYPEAGPRRFIRFIDVCVLLCKIHHIIPAALNRYRMKDFDSEQEQEVDSVRGAFLCMRRSLYDDLGWAFDPRYFLWFEDVDVCREAKARGYKVMYMPHIACVDYFGRSFAKRNTLWKQKQFFTSLVQYWHKWGSL